MPFAHQIAISGNTGVGTSSLFDALKEKLKGQPYRWFSGGEHMRARAIEQGFSSIDRFVTHILEHPEEGHDHWLDTLIRVAAQTDWLVCESRLACLWMPDAFRVYVGCALGIRAFRRHQDRKVSTVDQVKDEIMCRDGQDEARYRHLYGAGFLDRRLHHLVLDTDEDGSASELADKLLLAHKLWTARLFPVQAGSFAAP